MADQSPTSNDADRNWRRFVLFRVFFNARFYYPVLAILFLDLGLSATEYTLLNFAWAIAIVLTDVPAGVLADRIGRKPLVVAAALFMVLEMILLGIAPRHGGATLLACCLANRVFSGMAEGMASGADEALVFDSLAERGRSSEWPLVLDQVMRWQGVGMIIAMLVGGAVYDPGFMNRLGAAFHWSLHLDQATSLRFPIYLNAVTALLTLFLALGLREPKARLAHAAPVEAESTGPQGGAWHMVVGAGKWIIGTPIALFVIVAGVLLDSVSRLFMTFSSSYFRLIELPEVSYGLIGALLGGIGLFVSPLARRMVKGGSIAGNFAAGSFQPDGRGVSLDPCWRHLRFSPRRRDDDSRLHGFLLSECAGRFPSPRHRAFVQGARLQSRLRIWQPPVRARAPRRARSSQHRGCAGLGFENAPALASGGGHPVRCLFSQARISAAPTDLISPSLDHF
jgi:MFS family permease